MWITSLMSSNSADNPKASKGSVLGAGAGEVEVDTSLLLKDIAVVAPYGVICMPVAGEESVVIPTTSGNVALGVVSPKVKDLQPGELMLKSAGGATIRLSNDGYVYINGKKVGA